MNSSELRKANFLALFKKYRNDHPEWPDRGMLKRFAEVVDVSDRYLSHVKNGRKQIGSEIARRIENRLGLRSGWMDVPHSGTNAVNEDKLTFTQMVSTLYDESPEDARVFLGEFMRFRLGAGKTRAATKKDVNIA